MNEAPQAPEASPPTKSADTRDSKAYLLYLIGFLWFVSFFVAIYDTPNPREGSIQYEVGRNLQEFQGQLNVFIEDSAKSFEDTGLLGRIVGNLAIGYSMRESGAQVFKNIADAYPLYTSAGPVLDAVILSAFITLILVGFWMNFVSEDNPVGSQVFLDSSLVALLFFWGIYLYLHYQVDFGGISTELSTSVDTSEGIRVLLLGILSVLLHILINVGGFISELLAVGYAYLGGGNPGAEVGKSLVGAFSVAVSLDKFLDLRALLTLAALTIVVPIFQALVMWVGLRANGLRQSVGAIAVLPILVTGITLYLAFLAGSNFLGLEPLG